MISIDWENSESYLLLNPSYPKSEQNRFYTILRASNAWPGHIWLATSGSSVQKWVGLSKQAILASAQAVNQHLESDSEDRWINALPFFHIGGLGIWARACLSRAKVYDFHQEHLGKWQAEAFFRYIQRVGGTLSALVPAQLYDLVMLGYLAPESMRAIIIGGGALSPILYQQAIDLKWPILPSYGLTECASQVATANLGSWRGNQVPILKLLPHIQAKESEGFLCLSGPSLLSTYAYFNDDDIQFIDPKNQGYLITEDRGRIDNKQLSILGRTDSIIKVGGESVDLACLESLLQTLKIQMAIEIDVTLVAMPDMRLGHSIHLAVECSEQCRVALLIRKFEESVLPFERIRGVHCISDFPRSAIGKILKSKLVDLIKNKFLH